MHVTVLMNDFCGGGDRMDIIFLLMPFLIICLSFDFLRFLIVSVCTDLELSVRLLIGTVLHGVTFLLSWQLST